MKDLLRVLRYVRPYWRLAVGTGFFVVLASLISLLLPWPLGWLVSVLEGRPLPGAVSKAGGWFADGKWGMVAFLVGLGFFFTLLENVVNVLNNYVHTNLEQKMVLDFRSDLFEHSQRL